jgi:hypothetical protein
MPYYLAARFVNWMKTLSPYASIRTIIYLEQRGRLIAYRFVRAEYWYILVIGDRPPCVVHRKLLEHINRGTRMRIGETALTKLYAKWQQKQQQKER